MGFAGLHANRLVLVSATNCLKQNAERTTDINMADYSRDDRANEFQHQAGALLLGGHVPQGRVATAFLE